MTFKVNCIGITEHKLHDLCEKVSICGLAVTAIGLLLTTSGHIGRQLVTYWKYAGDDAAQEYFNEIHDEVFDE